MGSDRSGSDSLLKGYRVKDRLMIYLQAHDLFAENIS